MRRKLSDLRLMAPQFRIECVQIQNRDTLIISDARYVTGRAVLFTVDPDDIFDADGNRFENDLFNLSWIEDHSEIQSLPFDALGVSKER